MLKDFHQHQEPPPGFGRDFPGFPMSNLCVPFSRQQITILLLSVSLLVLIINLWFSLRRPKFRRLPKVQIAILSDHFVQQQMQELANDARQQFMSGVAAYQQQHWSQAEKHFLNVLQQEPNQPNLHALLGLAMLYGKRTEKAIYYLKVAVDSNCALREDALWNLAQAYLLETKADLAEEALQRLVALNGKYAHEAREQLRRLQPIRD
ncbi:MAG: tetratricopeptide repeat protein [candidate division KSB1 bacterium]|nr:tetratricopeptide repeat protein [candidate division KSB1 bacterium]MDQ7063269.1 tetratricopeptide repeat protein [candidate division KSB1 bacterium]